MSAGGNSQLLSLTRMARGYFQYFWRGLESRERLFLRAESQKVRKGREVEIGLAADNPRMSAENRHMVPPRLQRVRRFS